jgi:hypothetical protein
LRIKKACVKFFRANVPNSFNAFCFHSSYNRLMAI